MWLLFFLIPLLVSCQDNFDFLPGYEEVTKKPPESLEALSKCGEGGKEEKSICVPYYMCDGLTRTIIQNGQTNGFGVIDIRFGNNFCDDYLEVCCKIPKEGLPPPEPSDDPLPPPKPSDDPHENQNQHCGIRNPNGIDFKISGNKDREAEYGEFPWMIAVLKKHYRPSVDSVLALCGGSLITPSVVLTAAHCVYNRKVQDIKIRAGEWDTQTKKERLPYQERDVSKIIVRDDFNPQTLFNDLALLILGDALNKADNIGTICLPDQGEIVDSRSCYASGWGKDVFGKEGKMQVILKKIELPIVPHSACEETLRTTRLGRHFILDNSFTCAGGVPGKDTCTGDGGSPLVCPDPKNPGRYVQTGIVAWGIGCGESGIPGIYADVSKFRHWIDDNLKRLNFDTRPYYA